MSPAFSPGPVPRDRVPRKADLRGFSARIYKIGINPVVDVPANVSTALGGRGPIPVAGLLEDVPIRATLVPTGGARHRLFLNTAMREAAGVGEGDTVRIALARDPLPRPIQIPGDLERAFGEHKGSRETFESLTAAWRRQAIVWLEDAKRPETRERRLQKILSHVLDRQEEPREA